MIFNICFAKYENIVKPAYFTTGLSPSPLTPSLRAVNPFRWTIGAIAFPVLCDLIKFGLKLPDDFSILNKCPGQI
jgi:hypothetical protein